MFQLALVLSFTLWIASTLNWVIRMAADMEMQMNAIERIEFYTKVETEDYDGKEESRNNETIFLLSFPLSWPHLTYM